MNFPNRIIVASATLVLSSCTVHMPINMSDNYCAKIDYIRFSRKPEAPIEEMERVSPKDHVGQSRVLMEYIQKLHQHIDNERKEVRMQVLEHHIQCDLQK